MSRAASTPPHLCGNPLTDSEITSRSESSYLFFSRPSYMERRFLCKQSASRLSTADSSTRRLKSADPCMGARQRQSPHTQEIAAEQQISHQQICYAVATPIKRTFYHKLRGAQHRLHVATPETVPCTSRLRSSYPLRDTGGMQEEEPLRSSGLVGNPTRSAAECGDSTIYDNMSFVETALLKSLLRSSTSIIHHFPHIVAALQCGAICKATALRLANMERRYSMERRSIHHSRKFTYLLTNQIQECI